MNDVRQLLENEDAAHLALGRIGDEVEFLLDASVRLLIWAEENVEGEPWPYEWQVFAATVNRMLGRDEGETFAGVLT